MNNWGERLIDTVLSVIVGALALVATFLIPSDDKIKNNEIANYKSGKYLIFAAGFASIFVGVFVIYLYSANKDDQTILNIMKMVFFFILGITLIGVNVKKSKFIAECESAVVPTGAEMSGVEVPAPSATQPTAQQVVTPQTQVVTQQPAVPATTTVPTQPQVAAQQRVQATQVVSPQTQVTAPQPQPKAPAKPKIVVIKCPKCKGDMQINTSMLGQKIKCPHCGVEGKIG